MASASGAHAAGTASRRGAGWRTLGAFWLVLGIGVAGTGAVLQILGPPGAVTQAVAPLSTGPEAAAEAAAPPPKEQTQAAAVAAPPVARPAISAGPRTPGAPIPAPDDILLEPAPDFPGRSLPRVAAADPAAGRSSPLLPMKAYAGGVNAADHTARVAVLLAGMGMSVADSADAIEHTPAAVTLAFTPYAPSPDLTRVRALGHEFLVSIPMEPAGYPLNDEGPQSLLTGASAASNKLHLEWTLSRIEGYAGTTSALGLLRGERFANAGLLLSQMTGELQTRGLYYIDARAGQGPPAGVPGRGVDLVIDEPPAAADIDAKLAALEHLAVTNGTALGLAGNPRPTTVDRIAAWAQRLQSRGVVLVPVSAVLAETPAETPATPPVRRDAAQ